MSFKFLFTLKKKKTEVNNEIVVCANCETQFSGNFCPNCGQAIKEYDKPFSFVFYNFLGDIFAFDMRFFQTIVALLFKPGFLSKEYIEGRRVKFAPPFRIFVFVSFILFLLLQIYTNHGLTTILDSEFNDIQSRLDSTSDGEVDSLITVAYAEMDSSEMQVADSILTKIGVSKDSLTQNKLNFTANLETFRDTRDLRQALNKYAAELEQKLKTETNRKERLKILEHIQLCRSPEHAMAKILKYISWAFFLLLPMLALILKLVYARRKQNYMRHLIFSIHIHSFIFVLMSVLVALYIIFSGNLETITGIIFFIFPVYFITALRKFYRQSIRKTILKFFIISLFYNIIFVVVLIATILNALKIF